VKLCEAHRLTAAERLPFISFIGEIIRISDESVDIGRETAKCRHIICQIGKKLAFLRQGRERVTAKQ